MKISGIICEYNPLHNGHLYHLEQVRRAGAEGIVAVMSGNFVQRGDAALLDKFTRARLAIEGGVDLVLELPVPYALAPAENFAMGGVALLTALASLFPTSESLRRVTKLAGGVALTCLLFSPLVTFDYDAYAAALQDYHVSVSTDGAVSDSSERLQRTVIESELRAYILDKAAQCGAVLDDAQVTLQWSTDGYWYPQSVRLVTSGPAAENSRLAQIIEADLGVPRTRQEWSSTS